jgi:hypothetical protein
MCHRLARRGLFVGPSSGAYVHAALESAATSRYRTLATVLSDTGERYGSTGMWAGGSPGACLSHRCIARRAPGAGCLILVQPSQPPYYNS